MKFLVQVGLFIFSKIQLIGEKIIPTRNNLIAIGCQNGRVFNGNIRAISKYINQLKDSPVDFYIFTKKKNLYKELQLEFNKKAVYSFSLRGVYLFLKCDWIFLSHGPSDIPPFSVTGTTKKLFNLWHGAPLKCIGNSIHNNSENNYGQFFSKLTYFSVSCDIEKQTMQKVFNLRSDQVSITGISRNDKLIRLSHKKKDSNTTYKILYAPTFRDDNSSVELFPFEDLDLEQLNQFLIDSNIEIHIRSHINELENSGKRILSSPLQLIQANSPSIEIEVYMSKMDALITDYSGIFFDFLLLEKPIMFFPYDIESYQKNRGFLYSYEEVTPGPKILSQEDFILYLQQIVNGENSYSDKIMLAKNTFHKHQDGLNCKRILNLVTTHNKPS